MAKIGTTPVSDKKVKPSTLDDSSAVTASSQQITTDKEITNEIETRIESSVETGISKGVIRSIDDDINNNNTLISIQKTIITEQKAIKDAANIVNTDFTASSASQRITQLRSQNFIPSKNKYDIIRALQKLQMHCNHSYSVITNRCNLCNKHKNNHYHD